MISPDFDWNDIPLILSLAGSGSMSATGRALGMDGSTISRRIAAAEKALQFRLFIRDNTRYRLTDVGQVFVGYAESVVDGVQNMLLASSMQAGAIAGPVRITSIDFMFDHWLINHIPALNAQHPHLQLTLLADNQRLSFMRHETDFALRLAKPTEDAAIVMRKLGELGMAVYCSDSFGAAPRESWAEQPWIAYDEELAQVPEMRWQAALNPTLRQVLRVNRATTAVRACRAGIGLAMLPCVLGGHEGLRRLSAAPELSRELWLLGHRDAGEIARFKAVAQWLTQVYADSKAELTGMPA